MNFPPGESAGSMANFRSCVICSSTITGIDRKAHNESAIPITQRITRLPVRRHRRLRASFRMGNSGSDRRTPSISGSLTATSIPVSMGAMKRYPRRATVSTYRGVSAESCSTCPKPRHSRVQTSVEIDKGAVRPEAGA